MKRLFCAALALATVGSAAAQLQISIGIRETGAAGGPFNGIGGNGGSSGGIEWVNLDGQTLVMDGTWQQFSFSILTDPLSPFAGTTANGVLDGAYGVLEHIRIRNTNGHTEELRVWIDDVANTITPVGGGPVTTTFGDFEGFAPGTEVIFQEPRFSGSTSGNLLTVPNTTLVVNNVAHNGTNSDLANFQFVDGTNTRWVRLTTFNTPNLPNPGIRFDQQSVVSFWMRGQVVPEPASMIALGIGAAAVLLRRKRR